MDSEPTPRTATVGVCRLTRDGVVTDADGAVADLLNADSRDTVVGRDLGSFCRPREDWAGLVERVRSGRGGAEAELDLRDGDPGRLLLTAWSDDADGRGEVGAVIRAAPDRRTTGDWGRQRDRYLDRLMEASNDSLWLFGPDWEELLYINSAYEEIFGQPVERIRETPTQFLDATHPDDRDRVRAAMGTLSEGRPVEIEFRVNPPSFERWVWVQGQPVHEAGEVVAIAGFTRDITARRRTQQRIERLNRAAVDLAQHESTGAVLDAAVDHVAALFGTPYAAVWERDAGGDRPEAVALTDRAAALVRDGPAESMAALVRDGDGDGDEDGEGDGADPIRAAFDAEELAVHGGASPPDATDAPIESVIVTPLGDRRALAVGFDAADAFDDVDVNLLTVFGQYLSGILETLDREAALEATTERLEQSNERLQQFAYVASHDLQEPLRMVSSYVDLLETEYGDCLDEEAREYIAFAVDGAERMRNMIDDLLRFSRVESGAREPERIDADAVLDDALRDLQVRIGESGAEVTRDPLPTVRADPNQLTQVFQNLLANAIDYAGDGPPRVHVSATERADAVEFAVADEGIGIPADQLDRMFEVFTRGERNDGDSGTGIGLAICQRIVGRHGGEIWAESAAGDGTTVRFTIPTEAGQ